MPMLVLDLPSQHDFAVKDTNRNFTLCLQWSIFSYATGHCYSMLGSLQVDFLAISRAKAAVLSSSAFSIMAAQVPRLPAAEGISFGSRKNPKCIKVEAKKGIPPGCPES